MHRPPHQKGRRHSAGKFQSVATALRKALCYECGAQRKACQNVPLKPSKTQPGSLPNLPKSRPGTLLADNMRPRAPKRRPRGAQEAPKRGQEPPKRTQKPAKCTQELPPRDPDPSKTELGDLQDKFLAQSWQKTLFDRRPGRILFVFSVVRWMADMRFVLVFPIQNACRAFFALHACAGKKTSKNKALGHPKPSPDPLGTLQNRARAPQDAQKPAKNNNKRSKKHKMPPRSAQERKIVPTWLQQGLTVFDRRDGWPPLR